jgi:hypothetical protein
MLSIALIIAGRLESQKAWKQISLEAGKLEGSKAMKFRGVGGFI